MSPFRTIAVAAAAGWYLYLAPWDEAAIRVRRDLPLSRWVKVSAHESARECETARLREQDLALSNTTFPVGGRTIEQRTVLALRWADGSECVSSDDIRLLRQ